MSASGETVYMKGDRNVEIQKKDVTLGDIVALECSNKALIPKLKTLRIMKIPEQGRQRFVISVLKIIACIHEKYPEIDVQNLGETDMIITYEEQKTPGMMFHLIKTAVVMLITFSGAAFSIMAFNNDVSVTKLFSQIYEWVTGSKSDGFTILEIAYSVGITVGILVFFNHFGKKRFTVDPTPMEIQMRLYENDLQTTLIEDASRRELELDVGKSNHIGSHRS